MKKLLAILLALTMIFAFAACGSTPDEDDVRGDQNVNTTQASNSAEDNTTVPSGDVTDTPAGDITDTPADETTNAPEADVTEPEFSLGAVEGLNYENKFIGIGCNLPSDWTFYTDEQIRELNNITADMAGEDFKELMENADLVYDMFAVSNDQFKNINVNLQKVDKMSLAMISLEDIYVQTEEMMKQSLENIGYSNIKFEHGTSIMIEGKEFPCLKVTGQVNGMAGYQLLFATKCNGYIANFAITTFNENTVDDVLSYFYLIK